MKTDLKDTLNHLAKYGKNCDALGRLNEAIANLAAVREGKVVQS